MLYLADNSLTNLPNEIFTTLRHLEWLDVRNNQISSLPNSIESHPCIQTLLLQANNIEELPLGLCKPYVLVTNSKIICNSVTSQINKLLNTQLECKKISHVIRSLKNVS